MCNKSELDFTCNGRCSNCGNCCVPYLPITKQEYKTIKRYIKKHNIKEIRPIREGNDVYISCPFRDYKNKRCTIYPVRPEVCRKFLCSKSESEINANKKYYDLRADINGNPSNPFTPMDLLFYDNPEILFLLIIRFFKPENEEELFHILTNMQHPEIVEAIKRKDIKLEWSDKNESK